MSVGSPTAGTWSSSQWRPDNEFETDSLVEGPGIIVGRKGNVGSVFWSDEDFSVIDTAYFVTSSVPLRFLFYDLQTKNFINNDAAVPGLNRYQAYALEILAPPPDPIERFCKLADNFEHQASTLRRQIQNLRRTRDLLLPRLLSGQMALRSCKEITACTVDRRVVRCARGGGHPAGKACSAGARAHGAIAPGVGGD